LLRRNNLHRCLQSGQGADVKSRCSASFRGVGRRSAATQAMTTHVTCGCRTASVLASMAFPARSSSHDDESYYFGFVREMNLVIDTDVSNGPQRSSMVAVNLRFLCSARLSQLTSHGLHSIRPATNSAESDKERGGRIDESSHGDRCSMHAVHRLRYVKPKTDL